LKSGRVQKMTPDQKAMLDEFQAFSDLVGSATQLKLGGGHTKGYYDTGIDMGGGYTSKHAAEAWSNWWQLKTSPRKGWEDLMKRFVPQTDQAARTLLQRMILEAKK
jgi:hypothetical protein